MGDEEYGGCEDKGWLQGQLARMLAVGGMSVKSGSTDSADKTTYASVIILDVTHIICGKVVGSITSVAVLVG